MITAIDHPDARVGRYALHAHLVTDLIALGASRLVVGGSMLLTGEGTRYFQRRTGFTPVRVEVCPARHETTAVAGAVVGPTTLQRPAVDEDAEEAREPAAVS